MQAPALSLTGWLRYDLIHLLLRSQESVRSVLEIGTGTGALGARLAQRYAYTGLELDETACRIAARRVEPYGGRVIRGSVTALPDGAAYDLVCAFEVLEHAEDDRAALHAWGAHVCPGGRLLLSVPAFAHRFGPWDVRAGHFRRYDPADLEALLRSAGYQDPLVWAYGFPLGNVTEAVRHAIARVRPLGGTMEQRTRASGRALQPGDRLAWLTQSITLPFRLLQRPFRHSRRGVGLVALAARRDQESANGA